MTAPATEIARQPHKRWLIAVLWPSFALAGVATGVFFSTFDPHELRPFGNPVAGTRLAVYSIGFFAFWAYSALSIAVGTLLATLNERAQASAAPGDVNE